MTPQTPEVIRLVLCLLAQSVVGELQNVQLTMPEVNPNKADTHLCTGIALDQFQASYIVEFKPEALTMNAHQMLLFGCLEPGSDMPVWDCGEGYTSQPPCSEGSEIIYDWEKDSPELKLPQDVGFKVGGDSAIRYLVLQVHYQDSSQSKDSSGFDLVYTSERVQKRAGVLLLGTGGMIGSHSKENFEVACQIDEPIQIYPFAFRVVTRKLGKVVSGYKVEQGTEGHVWTLIGKKDPQLSEFFYPAADPNLVINQGDTVAARCTMWNDENWDVRVGPAADDEICNFFMMYYVEGEEILSSNICFSPGPPNYYWSKNTELSNIPRDASML